MKQWIKWIETPDFADPVTQLKANGLRVTQWIGLAIILFVGIFYFPVWTNLSILLLGIALPAMITSIWLLNQRKLQAARRILMLLTLISIPFVLITSGEGTHSIANLFYAITLVMAAQFLSRREMIFTLLLILSSIAILLYTEQAGIIPSLYATYKPNALLEDTIALGVIYIIFGLASHLAANSTISSLERAIRSEKQLAQKNQQLAESEERYRLISEVITDYTFASRVEEDGSVTNTWVAGAVRSVNGYSVDEFAAIGGWQATIHPDDKHIDDRDFAMLQNKQTVDSELRVIAKDGSIHWVHVTARPIWDEKENRLAGIYGATRDITAQKQAEQEILRLNTRLEARVAQRTKDLESALQELESFSYTISHDLRTPLRAINGYANIILDEHDQNLEPRLQNYLKMIDSNARRMGIMVDGLLTFIRLRRQELRLETIDTNSLVQEMLEDFDNAAAENPAEIHIADLPPCEADRMMLEQVYLGLLSNAFKFSRHKNPPRIEIGAKNDQGKVIYFVRDNGVGFDMKFQSMLFGMFQKLHSTGEFEGEGLGLATVKRIIQRHNGEIWAESQVGQGATFYFTLKTH